MAGLCSLPLRSLPRLFFGARAPQPARGACRALLVAPSLAASPFLLLACAPTRPRGLPRLSSLPLRPLPWLLPAARAPHAGRCALPGSARCPFARCLAFSLARGPPNPRAGHGRALLVATSLAASPFLWRAGAPTRARG